MEEKSKWVLSETEKNEFIKALTPELPLLRTKAEISQEELANFIGISRQTYGAIERKSKKMSWNTYLSLVLFFDYNIKTHEMIRLSSAFPKNLFEQTNVDHIDFAMDLLLLKNNKNILESLDEQAISTIKTVVMLEYSRCNNIPGDAVVKFFGGGDVSPSKRIRGQEKVMSAIKKIKEQR